MGVACLNAQSEAIEQGDDLEHTGHTSFSHSQRQPAHLTSASAQAWGDLECFFSEDAAPVLLDKGLLAQTNLWPCSGLIGWPKAVCVLGTELSSYQHGGWQNLANDRQWLPISSLCQFSTIP